MMSSCTVLLHFWIRLSITGWETHLKVGLCFHQVFPQARGGGEERLLASGVLGNLEGAVDRSSLDRLYFCGCPVSPSEGCSVCRTCLHGASRSTRRKFWWSPGESFDDGCTWFKCLASKMALLHRKRIKSDKYCGCSQSVVVFFPVDSSGSSRAFAVRLGNAQLRTCPGIPPQKPLLCVMRSFTVLTISSHFGLQKSK